VTRLISQRGVAVTANRIVRTRTETPFSATIRETLPQIEKHCRAEKKAARRVAICRQTPTAELQCYKNGRHLPIETTSSRDWSLFSVRFGRPVGDLDCAGRCVDQSVDQSGRVGLPAFGGHFADLVLDLFP
jgi:hypothetical protein